jgi:membrane protease YdiL (CAAX protease family)
MGVLTCSIFIFLYLALGVTFLLQLGYRGKKNQGGKTTLVMFILLICLLRIALFFLAIFRPAYFEDHEIHERPEIEILRVLAPSFCFMLIFYTVYLFWADTYFTAVSNDSVEFYHRSPKLQIAAIIVLIALVTITLLLELHGSHINLGATWSLAASEAVLLIINFVLLGCMVIYAYHLYRVFGFWKEGHPKFVTICHYIIGAFWACSFISSLFKCVLPLRPTAVRTWYLTFDLSAWVSSMIPS